ncbi:MAG: glycine zipper 2TM domain-containing protein [Pseudomonadota bacterium]
MKFRTCALAAALAIGSASAIADHRHKQCHHYDRYHTQHKHSERCYETVVVHERVVHRYHYTEPSAYRPERRQDRYGQVVHVQPVYRYISVPVNDYSCIEYDERRAGHTSYTATVLGAVVGGALGHRIGDAHGDPKAAAIAGGLLGASVGRDIDQRARYRRGLNVNGPCTQTNRVESRRELVEYKVTYRYNGRTHHARMDYDPGEWVKLDVSHRPA